MSGLEELPPAVVGAAGSAPDADARILRRVAPYLPSGGSAYRRAVIRGCALDVETTGLDYATSRIVQLAMQPFYVDGDGRICDVGRMRTWFEDPGEPLTREVAQLTGISDADVAGRTIPDGEASCTLLDVDFVVAHNSAFDRPMVERRLPEAAGRPWMCTLRDVAWRAMGFEGGSLSHLLLQCGLFYQAHDAAVDVSALLRLLDHRLARTGRTVVEEGLARARRRDAVVIASGAPFAAREALRARGYRWNQGSRRWEREIGLEEVETEERWVMAEVYRGRGSPTIVPMDWTRRYALH